MFIEGIVESIQYHKDTYYVLRVKQKGKKQPIVMAGDVIGMKLTRGSWIGARGRFKMHKKYGKQFEIELAPVQENWEDDQVCRILETQGLPVREIFGLKLFAQKQGKPIVEIVGSQDLIGKWLKKPSTDLSVQSIYVSWIRTLSLFDCLPKLESMGFTSKQINRLYRALGMDITRLAEDPWLLTKAGFSFEKADQLATRMGLDNPHLRMVSALTEVVKKSAQSGNTAVSLDDAQREVSKLVGFVEPHLLTSSLFSVSQMHKAKAGDVIWDNQNQSFLLQKLAFSERRSAEQLIIREQRTSPFVLLCREKGIANPAAYAKSLIQKATKILGIILSVEQEQGVLNALMNPLSIITGLPGTGKTTSLRVLTHTLMLAGFWTIPPKDLKTKGKSKVTPSQIRLMAPTGIAAKRMKEVTDVEAYTIHLALGGRPVKDDEDDEVDYHGIKEKAENDVIEGSLWNSRASEANEYIQYAIIDESSMMDIHLLDVILRKMPFNTAIVFIGDHCQLPSVGPGNVLRDLIQSKLFPTVHLTQIYRQDETSKIVTAAHAIVNGQDPEFEGDFKLVRCVNESQALHSIKHIAKKLYSLRRNFQILSPRHAGVVGVTNLNAELRELLNPPSIATKQIKIMTGYVREGDRVMFTKNRYDLGCYNGDVGKVVDINLKEGEILVKIHDQKKNRIVMLKSDDASNTLRLAYAQTVHKSQGQEYDIIVIPVLRTFGRQLQRNLLYTAVTRAKKTVLLVGEGFAVSKAVANDREGQRITLLIERLMSFLAFEEQKSNESQRKSV